MPARARAALLAAAPFLLLPLCWLPSILAGGASSAPPLVFFGPILLAAMRGGTLPAVAVALLSAVLAGPFTPQHVDSGTAQQTSDWIVRGGYFLAAAIGVAWAARRTRRQALHDPLTGLPNRSLLAEHLATALARARRSGRAVALAYIDLDDFKVVNDHLGHAAGDRLLVEVARRLRSCVRETDVLARQGGDEFLLLLADLESPEVAREAVTATFERIRVTLEQPVRISGAELQIGVSMGASVYPEDAADAQTLHRHADASMYRAKADGGGMALYERAGAAALLARLSLAARLRRAIDEDELELYYQPIYNLREDHVVGLEALVRWNHPRRGLVPPGEFIPTAEQTGIIDSIGDWALQELCRQSGRWLELGLAPHFGFNVSPGQLRRPDYAERMLVHLTAHGVDPRRVIVELTESAWMLDADRTGPALQALKDAGMVLGLDDFGAGYSSLGRLVDLPVDVIKVDRALLNGVPEREDSVAVLAAIRQLAETCRCDVVIEGIETEAQRECVADMGFALGQGFGLSRPMPATAATALLLERLGEARRISPLGEPRVAGR